MKWEVVYNNGKNRAEFHYKEHAENFARTVPGGKVQPVSINYVVGLETPAVLKKRRQAQK